MQCSTSTPDLATQPAVDVPIQPAVDIVEIDSHVVLVDLEITNNLDSMPCNVLPSTPDPAT